MNTGLCPTDVMSNINGSDMTIRIFCNLFPQCNTSIVDFHPHTYNSQLIDEDTIQDGVNGTQGDCLISKSNAPTYFVDPITGDVYLDDDDANRYSINADGELTYNPCL